MYGFHKINDMFHSNSSDVWEFKHPDFRRGEVELLQSIKRKATKQSQLQRSMADMSSDEKVTHLTHRVEELEQKLVKLHESYNLLWTETMSSRALQSKHHQIITSITQYLASNVDEVEADKSAKRRKLDVDTLVGEVAKISNPNQHHLNNGTRQDPHSMLPSPDSANSEYPPQGVWPASGALPSRPETVEGMGMVMTGPPGQIYRGEDDYYSHRNDSGKRRTGIGAPVG
ncbi:hypothetical protein HDV00_003179 [Rhizophlyctis rosea]|nr:hypothetical protein HDV00_003179 [Rhizophlyctis rosea]